MTSTAKGPTQAYSAQGAPISKVFPLPIVTTRDPTSTDVNYVLSQVWVNKSTPSLWYLGSKASGSATWIAAGSGTAGGVVTLTGDSGGAISPVAGNLDILGTANQVETTGTAGTITLSLPSAITAPGSLTTTTTLAGGTTVTAGTDLISTAGNLLLQGAGKQIRMEGGAATDFIGSATLVAGTVTIANTNIAAADVILVTREGINASTALGVLDTAITPATSFTITALNPTDGTTQANDVSTVKYVIIRQL